MRPANLSIGVFTGYRLCELTGGRWLWRSAEGDGCTGGNVRLFDQIRELLDFGVFGRFRKTMACSDKPLCGSRNQEVVFFSDRYSQLDLEPQGYEVTITEQDVITICKALGYDLNTVEFAIKDGIPYAIDFMNPAPDAELASVGEYNHRWIVDNMTDFILRKLEKGFDAPEYRWSAMLNPPEKPNAKITNAGDRAPRRAAAKK